MEWDGKAVERPKNKYNAAAAAGVAPRKTKHSAAAAGFGAITIRMQPRALAKGGDDESNDGAFFL
jgi:hypothetical protein